MNFGLGLIVATACLSAGAARAETDEAQIIAQFAGRMGPPPRRFVHADVQPILPTGGEVVRMQDGEANARPALGLCEGAIVILERWYAPSSGGPRAKPEPGAEPSLSERLRTEVRYAFAKHGEAPLTDRDCAGLNPIGTGFSYTGDAADLTQAAEMTVGFIDAVSEWHLESMLPFTRKGAVRYL